MNEKADFSSLAEYEKNSSQNDSQYFKFKEGSNPVRVLSNGAVIQSVQDGREYQGVYYQGREMEEGWSIQTKWMFWVIDRNDQVIKLARFGSKLVKQLEALQKKTDYGFDSFPMPYDIDINATGAGTKEVVYTIFPARNNTDLTADEIKGYEKQTPVKAIADRMRDKQMKKDGVTKPEDIQADPKENGVKKYQDGPNPDDIPF